MVFILTDCESKSTETLWGQYWVRSRAGEWQYKAFSPLLNHKDFKRLLRKIRKDKILKELPFVLIGVVAAVTSAISGHISDSLSD
jgi:hypothetical protein